MKKRIISIVLALCMVMMLVPTTVFAEGGNSHEGWTELTKEILDNCSYVLPSGNYYLGADLSLNESIRVGISNAADITLDLNGHTLSRTGSVALFSIACYTIGQESALTLTDSSSSKTGKVSCEYSVKISNNGTLVANGGMIEGEILMDSRTSVITNTDPSNTTVFTGEVTNYGTISGGIFTGTVAGHGTISDSAKVTVTFNSDGGSSVTEQKVLRGQKVTEPTKPTKEDYSFEGWYNGDTKYDFAGAVTENITLTARWKDSVNPVITGLENNKTYCNAVEFEVSDNIGVASVTADGVELLPTNGKYTLEKGIGTVKVVATDKSGNTSDVTVTVNNGHTWNNGVCSVCNYNCVHKDTNKDHICDYGCGVEIGTHEDTDKDHICDYGCNVSIGTHEDTNSDHKCDYGCNVSIGAHEDTNSDHNCEYCGAEITTCIDNDKNHICDICSKALSSHTGGTATCSAKAVCEYCGEEYGELEGSNHNLEKIPSKNATVTETGNTEYWHCDDCAKYFADENGTTEITLDDTVISKLPPEIIEGKGQSITVGETKELVFRSNAAFSDFIRVELDGKTLDEKNYTVKEGSTVVTLKADYVATLSAGEHTIGIVSTNGTATTTFTVNAKAVVDNDTKSPQTGDNSHMALWIALLFVSGGALIGTTVINKKRKRSTR